MDGSAAQGIANEVTITTDGLLILLIVGMVLVTAGFVVMWRLLDKHVNDCTGYRRGFHQTDGELKEKLTKVENDVVWIKRHMGYKGDDD